MTTFTNINGAPIDNICQEAVESLSKTNVQVEFTALLINFLSMYSFISIADIMYDKDYVDPDDPTRKVYAIFRYRQQKHSFSLQLLPFW